MAAGRDIKRETIRIRREQAERNRQAVAEAEARRSEMGKAKPSETRRVRGHKAAPTVTTRRDGHRMLYEDVRPLDGVSFASPKAKTIAEEKELTAEQFAEFEASGKNGFTSSDVREIASFYRELALLDEKDENEDEDEEKQDTEQYEDKMDRSGEDK